MMDSLPKDLWVQIFLGLPVKTLLQCLSVCKSWQLFIQHPLFISSHLQNQRRDLILVRSITMDTEKKLDSYRTEDDETTLAKKTKPECYSLNCDDESFTVYANHMFPFHHLWGGHYRVVGSCNGVICITDDASYIDHQTFLWNPTIQKCLELPCPMFTYDNIGPFDHELGFGFDEKTNDYKVVRIVEKDNCNEAPLEVEIYSVSSGIWRNASHLASDLGVRIFERAFSGRNHQVYLNGALHWVGDDRKQSRCTIIALHLGDEVFRCFEFPLDIKRDFRWIRKLRPVVFQGSLSLIHYSKPNCSIWIMKDYGDSTSWVKLLDVTLSNVVDRVIALRKEGELLIEIQAGLYSYKPTEGKEFNYLNENDLWNRKLLQEGQRVFDFVSQSVYDYDPEYAPKGLGIRSKKSTLFKNSFHSESYAESLVLLGRMNSAEVAKLRTNEPERIHEEDNKHVAHLVDELQNAGEESRQC